MKPIWFFSLRPPIRLVEDGRESAVVDGRPCYGHFMATFDAQAVQNDRSAVAETVKLTAHHLGANTDEKMLLALVAYDGEGDASGATARCAGSPQM